MAHGVLDSDRCALRMPEQRELLKSGRLHDRLEIAYPGGERDVRDHGVGQSAAALVHAQQGVLSGQGLDPRSPQGALELVFEVRQPVMGLDEQWSTAVMA